MLNLNLTPQRSDIKINYTIDNDILTVSINGLEEIFDFTDLPDGIAEEIIAETLPVNPIISVEKNGDDINITAIKFYGLDEKHMYERA